MAVTAECFPVIFPRHLIFGKPAVSFEHAFCQDNIHILYRMTHTPYIGNFLCAVLVQEIFEIHLVKHSFHIGHTDLKRSMDMFSAVSLVNRLGVSLCDDSFAVKFHYGKGLVFLYPFVFAHALRSAVLFYSDHIGGSLKLVVCNNNYAVRSVNIHTVDPYTAGKHQSVIGIELGKLTPADFHIKHDSLSDGNIKILPDK